MSAKKLGHEHVDFGQHGLDGRAHFVVDEGDDRLYFGLASSGAGIGCSLTASLDLADVDKLIDLLRRGSALVRADIERRATIELPLPLDGATP